MELQFEELSAGIGVIKLIGRLDIIGVGQIETRFAGYCAGANVRMIVDLSSVDFLASIGIRLVMVNAKSLASRNGKMALIKPSADVMHVLEVTGIPAVIPVYSNLESAEAVLLA